MPYFLDIGNTNLKIYNVEKGQVLSRELMAWSNFEITSLLRVLSGAKQVIVTSVVAEKEEFLREQLGLANIETKFAIKDIKPKIKIKVDEPNNVGADRIVNAIGAFEKYNTACITIDLGTALTVDAINQKGEFLGGVIAPGLRTAAKALEINAPFLAGHQLLGEVHLPGRNTGEAIRTGLVYMMAGGIEKIVKELSSNLGEKISVVGTGGDFGRIKDYLSFEYFDEPDLLALGMLVLSKIK